MKKTQKLPDHPGDLIRLAVLDIVASAQDTKHFEINMGDWVNPYDGKCEVCFAGAVMVQSLCVDRSDCKAPEDYDDDSRRKFYALNAFRMGDVDGAYSWLRRKFPATLPREVAVTRYYADRDLFLAGMLDLADMIDKAEAANG